MNDQLSGQLRELTAMLEAQAESYAEKDELIKKLESETEEWKNKTETLQSQLSEAERILEKEKEVNAAKVSMLHEKVVKLENDSKKLYETELEKLTRKLEAEQQEHAQCKASYSELKKKYHKSQKEMKERTEFHIKKITELENEVATARTYQHYKTETGRYAEEDNDSDDEKKEWEKKYKKMTQEIEILQRSLKTITKK